MSDAPNTQRDTRPFNFDDPTLNEVDEAAIASIGQDVQEQLEADAAAQFINRGGSPDTGVSPSTDQAPTTSSVGAPEAGSQVAPEAASGATVAAPDTSTEPTSFSIPIPGIDPNTGQAYAPITLTNEQALELLREHQYYATRPREQLEQWGSIEQGTHRAVPLQDYAAFQLWQKSGSPATKPARTFDPDDLPPDALEYIQRLEAAQNADLAQPHTEAPTTPADLMRQQQEQVNHQVALHQALDAVRQRYTEQYSLTPDQLTHLEVAVRDAQIIPAISQRHRVMNPLGTAVMAEGDPNVVLSEAFESVMATHPQFRQIRDDAMYQARLAKDQQLNNVVAGKKAAASSLAHVPSAAVTSQGSSQKSIEQMTQVERQAAMTAEIAQLIASGEAVH